jgi:hypothetical protein
MKPSGVSPAGARPRVPGRQEIEREVVLRDFALLSIREIRFGSAIGPIGRRRNGPTQGGDKELFIFDRLRP